jgi:hypothetical protein
MMISRMRTHGKRQPLPIHNRQDFHAFSPFGESDGLAAALGRGKGGIDKTLSFIDRAFVAQRIGQLGEGLPQHVALAPLLKPAMDGFVVGIALRQQMPLRAGVQNPEHGLQDGSGRDGFAAGPSVRDVPLQENVRESVPIGHHAAEACPDLYG